MRALGAYLSQQYLSVGRAVAGKEMDFRKMVTSKRENAASSEECKAVASPGTVCDDAICLRRK